MCLQCGTTDMWNDTSSSEDGLSVCAFPPNADCFIPTRTPFPPCAWTRGRKPPADAHCRVEIPAVESTPAPIPAQPPSPLPLTHIHRSTYRCTPFCIQYSLNVRFSFRLATLHTFVFYSRRTDFSFSLVFSILLLLFCCRCFSCVHLSCASYICQTLFSKKFFYLLSRSFAFLFIFKAWRRFGCTCLVTRSLYSRRSVTAQTSTKRRKRKKKKSKQKKHTPVVATDWTQSLFFCVIWQIRTNCGVDVPAIYFSFFYIRGLLLRERVSIDGAERLVHPRSRRLLFSLLLAFLFPFLSFHYYYYYYFFALPPTPTLSPFLLSLLILFLPLPSHYLPPHPAFRALVSVQLSCVATAGPHTVNLPLSPPKKIK
eukprot:Rhum_TRINITY_DN15413_c3_g1::Rhum_TRINITY_DN15413_c3_g1_i1::g.159489::m.159489